MKEDIIKKYYEKNPEGLQGIPSIPEVYQGHQLFIERVCRERPNTFLDAGCGKGYLGESLSLCVGKYYGFDISATAIAVAQQRIENGEFLVGSLRNLPYNSHFFNCIVCSEVLEHIPEYTLAITELVRTLKPGGMLFVSTPNKVNPDMILQTFLRGKYTDQVYDKPIHYKYLLKEFQSVGLVIREVFSFFYLPPFGERLPYFIRIPIMKLQEKISTLIKIPLGLYLFFSLQKRV